MGRFQYTELDIANISKKPGYSATQQAGAGVGAPLMALSAGEELLALMVDAYDVPEPVRELQFHAARKWRFDFAWPDHMLAVEIEGVTKEGGRHQRVDGFDKDCEKYEAAMLAGWTVYRVTHARVKSGRAIEVIRQMLGLDELL